MGASDDREKLRLEAHIVVKGLVQGVGYRFFAVRQADRLNIKGWARNNPDGTVEVIAQGSQEKLARFIELLEQGPTAAKVAGIEVNYREAATIYPDFKVLR